ncbi:GNAT family N-acetyltransferase [Alkaliphilus peptidifermentans]|uniref:Acetyltransferase (GNAT) domain-containing protein n=1 Tax=Alkaliphilus peptidifermentans DSM 18978 TaxID=1120976 RepID=A0A1G5AWV2_9FIRM|nr:GNAT family N-acetyltransferase [Alkaliphilus peptidifermentans]SCX82358.1 Acetyltransferase (GNAT) domain-containing protein [Alkaliphilus peptidifermentans DSM 18978]
MLRNKQVMTNDDKDFLFNVFKNNKQEEISLWGWREEEERLFIQNQFLCQQNSYEIQYPNLDKQLIIYNGQQVGYIYIHRDDKKITIVDLAILKEFRNKGIGKEQILFIQSVAKAANLPIQLSVFNNNPAVILYIKLGFKEVSCNELYHRMEWRPK